MGVGRRLQALVIATAGLLAATLPATAGPPAPSPALDPLDAAARAPATSVRIAPSRDGWLGAWLLVGPYRSATNGRKGAEAAGIDPLATAPPGLEETTLRPSLGLWWGPPFNPKTNEAPRWGIASSADGPIDVRSALHAYESDLVAYAAGTLHVERAGRLYLLLGVDDGVRLSVDGKPVFSRDESRPQRDDDDVIPLDVAAGDHPMVLKLHQRDGGWSFHVRVVDGDLSAPRGAFLALPGTTADDARALAAKMSWVSLDRLASGDGYKPKLTARYPEGAPRGVPLDVRARVVREEAAEDAPPQKLFDVAAGEVPLDAAGVGELVVRLPALGATDFPHDEDWTFEAVAAGRTVRMPLLPRRAIRAALARAETVLPPLEALTPSPGWLLPGSLESTEHLDDRVRYYASHGDTDIGAQLDEARELDAAVAQLEKQADPYARRTGLQRRAYRSPVDGELAELGLYVPPAFRRGARVGKNKREKTWPLIVVLHGLNGRPMAMVRYFFGGDDPKKENDWEDRHPLDPMPNLDAFVVAPSGHGNTMYRELGEDDVMRAVEWVERAYPIDRDRVTITGPSMGGIGSAAVPLHHPDVFAAAAPLCGYHSYFVRRDVLGHPIRPWERLLAEERSNVFWAENGERLPLWIVHGTQDLPESNSGVLIKRYEDLHYNITQDHPELGHNVWQWTYEDLDGATWLLRFRRERHPRSITFRTVRLRDGDDAWLHVDELSGPDVWGEVQARIRGKGVVTVTTAGVSALRIDRDEALLDPHGAVTVRIDGTSIAFEEDDPLALHLEGGTWTAGAPQHDRPWKRGEVTGPIRDAFHAPLLFVYGADDPLQTRANEEVARSWAAIRWGVSVHYPVMSDAEFLAKGEPLANDRALFLVGNARSNRVVRALEPELPIKVEGAAVVVGTQRFTGDQLGAAFVRPNPKRPDRYVVVIEGVDALGTWRSLSLPELLPDFVVYDREVAPSRGQMLLGAGLARAAGFFQNDWSLPASLADPLVSGVRPAPKTEYDATPYLP